MKCLRKIWFISLLLFIFNTVELSELHKDIVWVPITDWDRFVLALIDVESEGRDSIVGRNDDVGILQLTPIYVKEVNRLMKTDSFKLSHRWDRKRSLEMFDIIQSHYNVERDIDKAIRLHNPNAGEVYKSKIKRKISCLQDQKYKTI